MNNETCKLTHRYFDKFDFLDEDQSSPPRHKCCGCAYEQGLIDGHSGRVMSPQVELWPKSQAGTVRHKNAIQAYELGYEKGQSIQ